MVDAALGYAERLAGRGDIPYMKILSALFAMAAGIAAYCARPMVMITFSVTSVAFATLVVALRRMMGPSNESTSGAPPTP